MGHWRLSSTRRLAHGISSGTRCAPLIGLFLPTVVLGASAPAPGPAGPSAELLRQDHSAAASGNGSKTRRPAGRSGASRPQKRPRACPAGSRWQ